MAGRRGMPTRRATTAVADDLGRQGAGPDGVVPVRPALAAQEIRAQATAKDRSLGVARAASPADFVASVSVCTSTLMPVRDSNSAMIGLT